ncbi:MAG: flippase-like domain-containing protein [Actinobacteria bacterium]|nr:flippase-like domain-containing protein [Actinomycetota bacterium]
MRDQLDKAKAKRGVLIALSLGGLAIAIIMAFTFDTGTLDAFRKMNPVYLGFAVAAVFTSWIFSSIAFYVLARIIKTPISLLASGRVYLVGSFFAFITPFGSGLLPTQVYLLSKENLSAGQATAVASARIVTSSWLFAILGLAILITFKSSLPGVIGTNLLLGVILVAVAWSAIALYFVKRPGSAKNMVARILANRLVSSWMKKDLRERLEDKIDREIDHLSSNLKNIISPTNYPALAVVLACEVVAWIALFAVLPLVLFGLGWEGSFATLIFRMFLVFCLIPASPTPGGSGVVEVGFTGLLYDMVPSHIIGLVVLIWRALTYYLMLLIGSLITIRFFTRSIPPQPKASG